MAKYKVAVLAVMFSVMGCTHMRSVSTTSIPAQRDTPVKAEAYRFLFFMVNVDNTYVDSLATDLAKQCPNGRVEGVLTKQEDITYFPLIAHGVRVTATGYCQPGASK
jgi:hypothetical protein